MSLTIRRATADDLRSYLGRDMPADWCVEGWALGYAAEEGGQVIGYGVVTQDEYGRMWGWFSRRAPVSRFLMHRKATEMIALLRRAGEPVLFAICNEDIPGSDKWLRRLGFEPVEATEAGQVWRCDL